MAHTFLAPHQLISGSNALEEAIPYISTMGRQALIVTDDRMVSLGNVAKLTALLDTHQIGFHVFSEVNSEPDSLMIQQGVEAYHTQGCDFLIALGGGSPIDSMKAIAMMSNEASPISSFMGKTIDKALPAMIAIPTTAGTGSEATMFTIITDTATEVKMLLKGRCLIPDLAIIDPQFSMTAPKSVTSATGIDALCHAIEAYTSRLAQPLSDTFALSAIKRIFHHLPIVYEHPDNVESRAQMALAASEAGISFNNSSVTLVHGMSRPIGALFHIAHGLSNAMLLEECMRYVAFDAADRFASIAHFCDISAQMDDHQATLDFLAYLTKFLHQLHIPTLQEAGIPAEDFEKLIPKMVQDAMASGSPSNTIKEITAENLNELYHKLLKKEHHR